eukprot:c20724_g2_i1.p1 GENE.c20724_g2_i1~~c20724_g2_i1.p1  ORF type:complete len:317 (+),score=45.86 c20724_g2_i1:487-1437(+)
MCIWVARKKVKFPQSLVFNFMLAALLLHVTGSIGPLHGFERLWCHNAYTVAHESDVACGIQGTLMIYSGLTITFTWSALIINAFFGVVLGDSQTSRFRHSFKLFSFGLPLIPAIIGAASNKIDYALVALWCLPTTSGGGRWDFGLLYGPLYACLILCFILTLWSIWTVWRHEATMHNLSKAPTAGISRARVFSRKIAMLLAFIFAELVAIVVHAGHAHVREHSIVRSVESYVLCLFREHTERLVLGNQQVEFNCEITALLPFSVVVVPSILVSFNGTFLFLLFGLSEIRSSIPKTDSNKTIELKPKPTALIHMEPA